MSDIIEIGEDGTFDLPSPDRSQRVKVTDFSDATVQENEITIPTTPTVKDLAAGEYRMYKDTNGNIDVVVRLPSAGAQLPRVCFDEKQLYIENGDGKTLIVPLSEPPKEASSKIFEDFLVTKLIL